MSTHTPQTQNPQPTTRRTDPWAADADASTTALSVARAPRQFEPTSRVRMKNLMDEENAYSS
ncbi:MAG: hypothetical protein PPP58_00105 [Natronomonas sp.]